MILGYRKSLVI